VSFVFAAVLVLASLSGISAQQNAEKVLISIIKGPSGIASAWMMSDPPQSTGVELRFVTAASADLVTAKLISGEIQGGVLPVNVAAKLFNAGVPIQALAVVGNGMVKFLSADPAIRQLVDIRGRDIHIAGQKATPDYIFRFLAEKEGLKAGQDYRAIYNLAYPEMAAQLAAGMIDSAVLPEPFATQALLLNSSIREAIDLDALWKEKTGFDSYPMSLFVVSKALSIRQPQLVEAIGTSYARSIEWTNADPAATAKLVETLDLGMKAQVALVAIPKSNYIYIRASRAKASIEALLSLFLVSDPQSIGGKLPSGAFYAQ
jgi:NitT/TauT family transport system substrate-binding protein